MDRRKSLKIIAGTALAGGATLAGCNTVADKKETAVTPPGEPVFTLDRSPDEVRHEKEILAKGNFFSPHEMATIAVLADIIIPKDEISGSASEAKVPEFIEFIVKDIPEHQTPLRGGLRWLDMQCLKNYERSFTDCKPSEQMAIVDKIAYPDKVLPGMEPGVAFFTLMRNLVSTGFYTSEIGLKDLGYEGNKPHKWNGVPDNILDQYKLAYTEKELKECVKF